MTAEAHGGQHSPDGLYWWTGDEWITAWSPDFRYWFDGAEWVARSTPLQPRTVLLSKPDHIIGGIWIALALIATGFGMQAASHNNHPSSEPTWALWTLGGLGAGLFLLMPVIGYLAGRAPRRMPRMLCAGSLLSGALMISYILMMAASSDSSGDDAAGAGVVILVIPTVVVVAALMGLGGLLRLAVDWIRARAT